MFAVHQQKWKGLGKMKKKKRGCVRCSTATAGMEMYAVQTAGTGKNAKTAARMTRRNAGV